MLVVAVQYQKALQYILTTDQLRALDYPIEVETPDNKSALSQMLAENAEGQTMTCEKCQGLYVVKGELAETDMEACRFHWGRLTTKTGKPYTMFYFLFG